MCGRFPSTKPAALIDAIEAPAAASAAALAVAPRMPAGLTSWWDPRDNVAPTQPVRTLVLDDDAPSLRLTRWGLTPPPRGPARGPIINARSETAAGSPLFRGPLARTRALVVADGFYEWRGKRAPVRFAPDDDGAVTFAAIVRPWRHGEVMVPEVAILTGAAGALVTPIHDRQPVVIAAADRARWLDPALPADAIAALLAPAELAGWTMTPAPAWIGDARTERGAAPLTLL